MHNLAIYGFGGVGRAVLAQALPHFTLALVADRSGYVVGPLSNERWLAVAAAKAQGATLASLPEGTSGDWRAALPAGCLVADTTAEANAGQLVELVASGQRLALANKKPLCDDLNLFQALVGERRTRYEATVGAGLPIVVTTNLLRDTGDQVQRIEGCLSGTLGFLLSSIEQGQPYSAAVREAKALGWTEPDPRDDLGGVDVARKALILARTLGYQWNLSEIAIEPLYPAEFADLSIAEFMSQLEQLDAGYAQRQADAVAQGQTLRYVASISPAGARVGLQAVANNSPLGSLKGPDNLVAWTTKRYQERPLVVRGPGAGVEVTASAVLFDLLALR